MWLSTWPLYHKSAMVFLPSGYSANEKALEFCEHILRSSPETPGVKGSWDVAIAAQTEPV